MSTKLFLKQLKNIESLVKHKEEILEQEYYDKYHPIFEEARVFLTHEDILLYGGLAINELLPKKHQFYGEKELPDFDMFSVHGKALATRAVKHFKSHGFPLASFTEALHENTYKVMVSGLPVLDITQVTSDVYSKLSMNKQKTKYGLHTVNPQYLRMTLHQLLSQPKDAHRWMKLFKRVVSFYEVYPPKVNECIPKNTPTSTTLMVPSELEQKTLTWIRQHKYVVFSSHGWLNELPSRNSVVKQLKQVIHSVSLPMDILVDTKDKSLDTIVKDWHSFTKSISSVETSRLSFSKVIDNGFTPRHIYIYLDKQPIIGLFETTACISYIPGSTSSSLHIASIQTVLRMYMQMLLSEDTVMDKSSLECMVNLLTELSIKSISNNKNEFLKSFILSCYGNQPGMATLKRERYERVKK
jgi:hypothetical protein